MNSSFPEPKANGVGGRLKSARIASRLTTRELAARMPESHRLSHTSIANYESGRSSPPITVLEAMSNIFGKPLIWFLNDSDQLTGVQYRCRKSLVNKGDKEWFEASASQVLQAYALLERSLKDPLVATYSFNELNTDNPVKTAEWMRQLFKLKDDDAVPSMVGVLEAFGIRVVELATDLAIDGIAGKFGKELAIVTNSNTSNDRARMNFGHEILHAANRDCDGENIDHAAIEKRANTGASHLLLPQTQLESAFKGQSMVRLVQFKERFGISLAAMIYRAKESGIISDSTSKWLWIEFSRRGWRKKEPGQVRPDRATRFEQLLDTAIASEQYQWHDLAQITGMREEVLRDRRRIALGYPVEDIEEEDKGGEEEGDQVILKFPH